MADILGIWLSTLNEPPHSELDSIVQTSQILGSLGFGYIEHTGRDSPPRIGQG